MPRRNLEPPVGPDRPLGPPYTILSTVTTIDARKRVTVRLRGGRRFTVTTARGAVSDAEVRELVEKIAEGWPAKPPPIYG